MIYWNQVNETLPEQILFDVNFQKQMNQYPSLYGYPRHTGMGSTQVNEARVYGIFNSENVV